MAEEVLVGGEASFAEELVVEDAVGHEDLSLLGEAPEVDMEVVAVVAGMAVVVDSVVVVAVDVEAGIVDHKREICNQYIFQIANSLL